jgi:hypothetical protein
VTRLRAFLPLFMALTLSGCAALPPHPEYTLGFSTPAGNEITVRDAVFDKRSVPVGWMTCCWEEAGSTVSAHDLPLPRTVYVEWIQRKERLVYSARVTLTADLAKQARALPEYRWLSDNQRDRDVYLVVGMHPNGYTVVWLTNGRSAKNKAGHVLWVVGEAQALSRPWDPARPGE